MSVALPKLFDALAILTPSDDILGECPIWSAREGALYWIDVRAPAIRRLHIATGVRDNWVLPELIGAMALRSDGRIVVALRSGVALLDPATGHASPLATLHMPGSCMRLNDGKCDRQGRFWVGSMDDVGRGPVGRLYRLDAAGCVSVACGVAVPNSLCWSPDGTVMYFADGVDPIIWAYPFDTAAGTLGERRVFARLPEGTGIPDGATVDAAGHVWSANYGGSCITRYTPDGAVAQIIPVPVSQPTSCAFGGPDGDILFITTAFQRLAPEQRAKEPLAGAVLALRVQAQGLPEPGFGG
jgi:sugar lactone lactonase YvrE